MGRRLIPATVIVLLIGILLGFGGPVRAQTDPAYFLVAFPALYTLGLGDSYVLPLTDPDDIALARHIIDSGIFLIANATVTTGADGINRDMLAPDTPEWSWHVVRFNGFTESAIELCDGNPTDTETDALNSIEGAEWGICYWDYTVVEDVTSSIPVEPSQWGSIKAMYQD